MWEECTLEYIGWVRARFGGVWVCGLCEEAIKDERARFGGGVEVAPRVHATFRETANAGPPIPVAQSIVQLIKKIMCPNFPEAKAYNNLMVKRFEL
ncbi:hypothetical protein DKX38_018410 [Salix brachista]|uniref:Uncharacterized protein n=1 Tax=Salix brachista TaxID=2182728 RepID=A0A5N5KN10_9ROSI|nr:hypothetical protein DKX38_018410 [Salix brachista]